MAVCDARYHRLCEVGLRSHGGRCKEAARSLWLKYQKQGVSKMQERNAKNKSAVKPKVGLIVPIYNVQKYLAECLDSLLNQSYENLEIVLVDDKSTDSSLSIAKEYVKRDKRVSLIALGENSGQSVARNVAMDYLSGESYRQKVEQRLRGGGSL